MGKQDRHNWRAKREERQREAQKAGDAAMEWGAAKKAAKEAETAAEVEAAKAQAAAKLGEAKAREEAKERELSNPGAGTPWIPPELKKPGPRTIRRTDHASNDPWGVKSLIISLLLFVPLTFGFIGRIGVIFFGHRVEAIVEDHGTHLTKRHKMLVRTLFFRYLSPDGKRYGDSQSVTSSTFALHDGQPVAVKTFRLAGVEFVLVSQSFGDYLGNTLVIAFFAIMPAVWVWIAVCDIFIETPRRRALVRDGVAVLATVKEKEPHFRQTHPTQLKYAYEVPGVETFRRWEAVPRSYAEELEPGHQIVVIYPKKDPSAAQVYYLIGYEAVE